MIRFVISVLATLLLLSCEHVSKGSKVDKRRLLLLVETLSTQRGWAFTGTTQERLASLQKNAAWDVEGTVKMLEAAPDVAPETREQDLRSGVSELEIVTLDMIAGRIRGIDKRLGTGGPCTISPVSAEDAKRATERLRALLLPPGLSPELTARIERLRARAATVGDNPFHRASCEGPAPILFGWLDGLPVPLFDLVDK